MNRRDMLPMDVEDFEGSDLVKFIELYKSFGIDLIAGESVELFFNDDKTVDRITILLFGVDKIVEGFDGAFSEITFKGDGSFDYQLNGVE